MNCVVSAEAVRRRQVAGQAREGFIDLNNRQLRPQNFESIYRVAKHVGGDSSLTSGSSQGRSCLDVTNPRRYENIRLIPDQSSLSGADLIDEQLDDDGRVDIGDHRRCSATNSLTEPSDVRGTGR